MQDSGPRGERGGGGTADDTDMYDRALAAGMKIFYQPRALVHHMISRARGTRQFHRQKMLREQGPFYVALRAQRGPSRGCWGCLGGTLSKALTDSVQFLKAATSGNSPDRFYYEMQVMRFAGIFAESAKFYARRGR